MKGAERDQTVVYCAGTVGKREERDAFGNPTGRFVPVYGDPTPVRMNLSGKRGSVTPDKSGNRVRAKRFAVTCDTSLPIDEHTVFWIERDPVPAYGTDEGEPLPPDYVVDNVNRTKNSTTYTLLEVREG
ncbi:MAG: hypothetical protein IJM21_09160 [Clostridia bacterium]|nr:hypothetical protein [Clostridia bacterium]